MFNFVLHEQSIPVPDLFSWYLFALSSTVFMAHTHRIAVKQVLLQLRPRLSEKKLLVSIAAGIKMQDLQVSARLKILPSLSI
jgi:pyrroline-5-carboxylate reductase